MCKLNRAGAMLLLLLSGLLFMFTLRANAQSVDSGHSFHADTERVGQDADTTRVIRADSAQAAGSGAGAVYADTAASGDREQAGADSARHSPEPLRTISDSTAAVWQRDEDFAYANDPAYWRYREVDHSRGWLERLLESEGFRYFMLFLLGGILLYAIIRIISENNLRLFYRSAPVKAAGGGEESGQPEEDPEGLLQHYLQTGNHRQAVRWLYRKALRLLNDRGLIRYHQQTTNREYLGQLAGTPLASPFRDLTLAYEKVWYGELPIGDVPFARLHQYFEEFYKSCRA